MKIVTTYTTRPNSNVGKIVAKSGGKQKSTTFDQSKSSDWNHGNAAGEFILSHPNVPFNTAVLVAGIDSIRHDSNDSGTVHTFEV